MPKRRIFVSATSNRGLDERRRALKAALVAQLASHGFEAQEFWESGLAQRYAWSFDTVDLVMRKCVGAMVIGFPRWDAGAEGELRLVGEYNHYEGAVALTYRLPTLLLAERGVLDRGVVWTGGGRPVTFMPEDATPDWLQSPDFRKGFDVWLEQVQDRRDVFLGYCSQNVGVAAQIENILVRRGATVLNYAMDFGMGTSILGEIESACARCAAGIFVFGENDPLQGQPGQAAPRDNVVFEAGYFMSAKGPDRCLVVRIGDAKMPADLGGAIYLSVAGHDVAAIEAKLARFLDASL